jgi:hypothetical protein
MEDINAGAQDAGKQVVTPNSGADPFALDEAAFASLSPEQRAAVEPIITTWKERANEEISKRETSYTEKYKPYEEKAQALEKLTSYAPFQKWWQEQQMQAQRQNPGNGQPAEFGQVKNDPEWQAAILDASTGDPTKLQALQSKFMNDYFTPIAQRLAATQLEIKKELEFKDLLDAYPDMKELDAIGLDPKTKEGVSLLQMGLEWAENNGKSMADGYQLARRWADQMQAGAKDQAMGMVKGKKDGIITGPSSQSSNTNVIAVRDADELIRRSMEAQMDGRKDLRFVIAGK